MISGSILTTDWLTPPNVGQGENYCKKFDYRSAADPFDKLRAGFAAATTMKTALETDPSTKSEGRTPKAFASSGMKDETVSSADAFQFDATHCVGSPETFLRIQNLQAG